MLISVEEVKEKRVGLFKKSVFFFFIFVLFWFFFENNSWGFSPSKNPKNPFWGFL